MSYYEETCWEIKTEPFDWFGNEKSIDLPIFANISSAGIQNSYCKAGFQQSQYPYFDSPEYEPTTFVPTNYGLGESATVAEATQPQLMYAPPPPPFNAAEASAPISATTSSIDMFATSPQFVDCDPKREVLTPPESPKEQDLFRILEEMQTKDLLPPLFDKRCENALLEANLTATRAMTTAFGPSGCDLSIRSTENSCPAADDLSSDYAASSPSYGCSESGSDNDADYVPRRGGASRRRAAAATTGGRKRATKPASRHSTEERRLRKKEQNKNAATRYRMKKKQEVEACKNEEQRLADRNRELRNTLDDISREIKCLKSLMRDVYRKKGLIK